MIALADWIQACPPLASVALCLAGVGGIVVCRRLPNLREAVSLSVAGTNFALVLWMYGRFRDTGDSMGGEVLQIAPGLSLALRVDALGLIFALVASGLWILNTLYSIGYMRAHDEHQQTRFYSCFSIAIAAAMGASFSANLFTLFAFYELLTICTYPLVIHAETDKARAGAKRYISYLLGSSIAFQLPALFLVWGMAQSFAFTDGGLLAAAGASGPLVGVAFVLFMVGIAKSGMMPVHSWLPAAMVAPTPVSALLHAVAVVKMGVFAMARVVLDVFGPSLLEANGVHVVLVVAACFTIVCGSLVALVQDNLKRRLAYSTISQLSYILLGLGLLHPAALVGALLHIAFHACAKITLFFGAGAIYVAEHKTNVSQLDGIGRRMPVTMTAFAIGSLAMIGFPPTAAIWSKWYLAVGAGSLSNYAVLAVLFLSTILNAAYFLPIVWRAFFVAPPSADPSGVGAQPGIKEAPWPCVVALSATACLTLLLFFFPQVVLELATDAVAAATGARR